MLYHMLSSSQNKEVKYNQAEELARLILGLGHQTDTINGTNDDGVGLCLQTHICRRKAQSKKTKKPNLHAPLSQNQAQVTTASCSTYHSQNIEFVHFIPFTENVGCPLYVDMMSYASSPHRYRWHHQASLSFLAKVLIALHELVSLSSTESREEDTIEAWGTCWKHMWPQQLLHILHGYRWTWWHTR